MKHYFIVNILRYLNVGIYIYGFKILVSTFLDSDFEIFK